MRYEIKNAADALALLDMDDVVIKDLDFSSFSSHKIELKGKEFNSTITPTVMEGYEELQKFIYHAYSIIKVNQGFSKHLTADEKNRLEISVSVGEGSSLFQIFNADDIIALFQKAIENMSGAETLIAVAILSAVAGGYIGKGCFESWMRYKTDIKKIDSDNLLREQETRRWEKLADIARCNPILSSIMREGEKSHKALLSSTLNADVIKLDDVPTAKDDIEQVLQKEYIAIVPVQLNGQYRIISVSATDEDCFNIRLSPVKEGRPLTAKIENLILKTYYDSIHTALFNRQPMFFAINGRERGGEIVSADIVSAD